MVFRAIWHEESLKDLKKLNITIAKKIAKKVKNNLIQNPIELGTQLKGNLKGFYRYRIGEYRVIYVLDHKEKKVIILNVNHRKKIYKQKIHREY